MGDRGNIIIRQESDNNRNDIWLYTHWNGSAIRQVAQAALARRLRWDDPAYLARIVFAEMTKDAPKPDTGYGIATYAMDNEHDLVVLDAASQCVFIIPKPREPGYRLPDDKLSALDAKHAWTFEEFLGQKFPEEQ